MLRHIHLLLEVADLTRLQWVCLYPGHLDGEKVDSEVQKDLNFEG